MKVEIVNHIGGYLTRFYDLDEELLEDYIGWCEESKYDYNSEYSLLEYLDCLEDCEEDLDLGYTEIVDHTDLSEILLKCKEIANEYKRSETEVSRDNSETE